MISARLLPRYNTAIALVKRDVCVAPLLQVEHRLMLFTGYTLILTSRLGCATRIHYGGIAYNRVMCYAEVEVGVNLQKIAGVSLKRWAADLYDLGGGLLGLMDVVI